MGATAELRALRIRFRCTLRDKKAAFLIQRETRLIEEAATRPYVWLRTDRLRGNYPIPADVLTGHFSRLFISDDTAPRIVPSVHFVRTEANQAEHDALVRAITLYE